MKFFTPDTPELFRMTEQGLTFHPKIDDLLSDPTYWSTPEARRHAAIAAALWQGETSKAQADAYRQSLMDLYSAAGIELPEEFVPGVEASRIIVGLTSKKPAKAKTKANTTPRIPRAKKTQPAPATQAYDGPTGMEAPGTVQ